MALQIRKGTNAERILIIPLPGELIYVTDYSTAPPGTNAVYVGDGSTAGGVPVAVSPALAGTLSGNISLGGYQINGNGSIAVTGNISNTGNLTVTGNILGNGNISRTGNLTISGDGSVSGVLTAGAFEGELIGSVFSDDSSGPLVNAIDSTFNGNKLTIQGTGGATTELFSNNLIYSDVNIDTYFNIGTPTSTLGVNFYLDKPIRLNVAIDPAGDYVNAATQSVIVYRGTDLVPTNIAQNDILSGTTVSAFTNGAQGIAGFIQLIAEDQVGADVGVAPSSWVFGTGTLAKDVILGSGDPFDQGNLVFNSKGTLQVPLLKVVSYDNGGESDIDPEAGMIIFNSQTGKFRGYNGTAWVDLS